MYQSPTTFTILAINTIRDLFCHRHSTGAQIYEVLRRQQNSRPPCSVFLSPTASRSVAKCHILAMTQHGNLNTPVAHTHNIDDYWSLCLLTEAIWIIVNASYSVFLSTSWSRCAAAVMHTFNKRLPSKLTADSDGTGRYQLFHCAKIWWLGSLVGTKKTADQFQSVAWSTIKTRSNRCDNRSHTRLHTINCYFMFFCILQFKTWTCITLILKHTQTTLPI